MKALLLAAGEGRRLLPLTKLLPKCLMPVNGVPLIAYWLEALSQAGIDEVLINCSHLSAQVTNYLATLSLDLNITVVHEKKLLGTGGTLHANREFFGTQPIMVIHADNLIQCDLKEFIERHESRPKQCLMTLLSFTTPTPETCGILELDSQGVVQNFHEKKAHPPGDLANGAVYIFESEVFKLLEDLSKFTIDLSTEVLPQWIGKMYTHHNALYHRDIGNLDSFLAAQIDFRYAAPTGLTVPTWHKVTQASHFIENFARHIEIGTGRKIRVLSSPEIFNPENEALESKELIIFKSVPTGFLASDFFDRHQIHSVAITQQQPSL